MRRGPRRGRENSVTVVCHPSWIRGTDYAGGPPERASPRTSPTSGLGRKGTGNSRQGMDVWEGPHTLDCNHFPGGGKRKTGNCAFSCPPGSSCNGWRTDSSVSAVRTASAARSDVALLTLHYIRRGH